LDASVVAAVTVVVAVAVVAAPELRAIVKLSEEVSLCSGRLYDMSFSAS
jgi:hypothetical protein